MGNLLFMWARSVIYAEKYGYRLVDPNWTGLKIGPILRGEKDKRTYAGIFKNIAVHGVHKLFVDIFSKKVSEDDLPLLSRKRRLILVNCSGVKGGMKEIVHHQELIRQRLLLMCDDSLLYRVNNENIAPVVVHIRLGDFMDFKADTEGRVTQNNTKLPISWYSHIIGMIRRSIGWDVMVDVFSDGTDSELRDILSMPNVRRRSLGNAMSDMLGLSRGKVLICSNSTFSAWASFIGGGNSIWYPGALNLKLHSDSNVFEGEVGYDVPIPARLENALEHLSRQLS